MRTPPPVLPPRGGEPEREPSGREPRGIDSWLALRTRGALIPIFLVSMLGAYGVASLRGIIGAPRLLIALAVSVPLTAALGLFIHRASAAGGAVAAKVFMPSGSSTPYESQYSFQEALAAKGDVQGALDSYEAVIIDNPFAPLPRLRAAELYAKGGRDLQRAAELFRSVREMPAASRRDALYASNRLVDLYDGPLSDPGRALVELRRIVEKFPGSPAATRAREALPGLKARLAADHDRRVAEDGA